MIFPNFSPLANVFFPTFDSPIMWFLVVILLLVDVYGK